jgi:transketolase N-terminal domain/subunit
VLNTVDLLDQIYHQRRDNEPVILDNGHASLAHYVVLESRGYCDAEEMIKKHGVHASRDMEHGIWCSNGSLGQAATVALGMALADRDRKVWLVTSDGACMEGCVWEVFRIAVDIKNLEVHIVCNGYGAYREIDIIDLPMWGEIHYCGRDYPSWLQGLAGHYLILNKEQYEELVA